ncbi:MAG: hypothetical protein JHD35_14820, partial [Sphingopyxis sp.]|nr:hypothetical protein [Sphingopyxis sp.]
MSKKNNRKLMRNAATIAAIALAGSAGQAQAAEKDLLSARDIEGVQDVRVLPNGDVELVFADGHVLRIAAADVVVQDGVVMIQASALGEAGLAGASAAGGLNPAVLAGLGALTLGGGALAASG